MTPSPPALETAAASGAPEVFPIPARRMGCWIFSSFVRGVTSDILVYAKNKNKSYCSYRYLILYLDIMGGAPKVDGIYMATRRLF